MLKKWDKKRKKERKIKTENMISQRIQRESQYLLFYIRPTIMSDVKKRKEKKQTEEEKDFNRKHDALQNTER